MHWDDVVHAEQADSGRGFARSHRVMITDREHSQIGGIELAYQLHVTEYGCVACVIDLEPTGQMDNVAAGFATVDHLVAILNSAGVNRVHHGDFDLAYSLRATLVHAARVLDALGIRASRTFRAWRRFAACASLPGRRRRRCDRSAHE